MYKVSVIVPVYNVEKYVVQAVDSILDQKLDGIEIILVNDGSTDSSGDIICRNYGNVCNIKIIEQENKGLSAARNTGLKAAKGEYILYLDSDDYFSADIIDTLLKKISDENAEILLFGGKRVVVDDLDNIKKIEQFGFNVNMTFEDGIAAYNYLRKHNVYYTGVYYQMARRDFLLTEKINFREGILHEDHLYSFTVFMRAKRIIVSDICAYNYRIRDNSIMTSSLRYDERFFGFAVTYIEMKKVIPFRVLSKVEMKVRKKHLIEEKWIAIKYFCKYFIWFLKI